MKKNKDVEVFQHILYGAKYVFPSVILIVAFVWCAINFPILTFGVFIFILMLALCYFVGGMMKELNEETTVKKKKRRKGTWSTV